MKKRNSAFRYYFGQGFDYNEAVQWLLKTAEQGHAKAQFILGHCHDAGDGVSKDTAKAIEWYKKAAAQEQEDAKKEMSMEFTSLATVDCPP